MECTNCNSCGGCNNDGCYYCVDFVWMGKGYVCVCKDGKNCENKKIGDVK